MILGFCIIVTPDGSVVKNMPTIQETQKTGVPSLGQEDPMEKEMATCSSIRAGIFPRTEKPGGLQLVTKESDTTEHAHKNAKSP